MTLSFVITILIALLGVFSAIVQQVEKNKSDAAVIIKDAELRNAQIQLKEKTEELQKYIAGDSSIPKLYALILSEEQKIKFHFTNGSNYPIPDVFVLVHDITQSISVKEGRIIYKAPNDAMLQPVHVGTLAPHEKIRPFYKTDLIPAERSQYMFSVNWRGGSYVGWVSLQRNNNIFKVVSYDYTLSDGGLVHEDAQ